MSNTNPDNVLAGFYRMENIRMIVIFIDAFENCILFPGSDKSEMFVRVSFQRCYSPPFHK